MRNIQELHDRYASQSHRSFYISPNLKLQAVSSKHFQPDMKAHFSKANKFEMLVNPYTERKTPLLHQKSQSNKLNFFQTPLPIPQKTSFVITKGVRNAASFFEKKDSQNKPFFNQLDLKKMDFVKVKDREKGREHISSPMPLIPEGLPTILYFILFFKCFHKATFPRRTSNFFMLLEREVSARFGKSFIKRPSIFMQ